ncbi:MAG: response regulator [Candidatus Latescibacterota bacterium]
MDKRLPEKNTGKGITPPDSKKSEATTAPQESATKKKWYQQKTILIVDDMLMMRFVLRAQLEGTGYRVLEAEDGEKALEIIQKEMNIEWRGGVDLVITDVVMTVMDGLELVKKLRQELGLTKLPVIVCTSRGEIDIVRRAKLLGVQGFLVKPIARPTLLATIKRVLG